MNRYRSGTVEDISDVRNLQIRREPWNDDGCICHRMDRKAGRELPSKRIEEVRAQIARS